MIKRFLAGKSEGLYLHQSPIRAHSAIYMFEHATVFEEHCQLETSTKRLAQNRLPGDVHKQVWEHAWISNQKSHH